jgi:RNA polymerase sigma factor (sigma-70 family)
MYADLPVVELVRAANDGDGAAWDALVDRYAGLVVGVARGFRLAAEDVADVSQTVWLRTVENLPRLRLPQALPAWLITITRNECLRLCERAARYPIRPAGTEPAAAEPADPQQPEIDEHLLRVEREAALREAFATLPTREKRLLALLLTDPPPSYQEISAMLGIPIGTIGPTRKRSIERLRTSPPLAALLSTEPAR